MLRKNIFSRIDVLLKIIFLIGILCVFPNAVFAGLDRGASLFSRNTRINVTSPLLNLDSAQKVLSLKSEVDQGVFGAFEHETDVEIDLTLFGAPKVRLEHHVIQLPFDSMKTFLKPKKDKESRFRYYKKNAPQFTNQEAFVHEYTHFFLLPEVERLVPELGEFYKIYRKLLKERRTDAQIEKIFSSNPTLEKLGRISQLFFPYDEVLADLGVVMQFEDPQAMTKALSRLAWAGERGSLYAWWRSHFFSKYQYRDFSFHYSKEYDLYPFLEEGHNVLGPSRTHIWDLYLKNKDFISKPQFFKKVFLCIIEEFKDQIFHDSFASENGGLKFDPKVINESLIKRMDDAFH